MAAAQKVCNVACARVAKRCSQYALLGGSGRRGRVPVTLVSHRMGRSIETQWIARWLRRAGIARTLTAHAPCGLPRPSIRHSPRQARRYDWSSPWRIDTPKSDLVLAETGADAVMSSARRRAARDFREPRHYLATSRICRPPKVDEGAALIIDSDDSTLSVNRGAHGSQHIIWYTRTRWRRQFCER